jgi:hypothetical protein
MNVFVFLIYLVLLDVVIMFFSHRRVKKRNAIIKTFLINSGRDHEFSDKSYIKNIFLFREIKQQKSKLSPEDNEKIVDIQKNFRIEISLIALLVASPFYAWVIAN